jgi:glutamate formiminotransferase
MIMTQDEIKEKKQELIERVVEQIKQDLADYGTEAIEELLGFCPIKNLVGYLPEEEWGKYLELELNS